MPLGSRHLPSLVAPAVHPWNGQREGGLCQGKKGTGIMGKHITDCEGFYRRDFIKIGAAGLMGLTLPQLLRLEARAATDNDEPAKKRRADAVIMLWLGGGPATIDMWDLKPDAPEGIRGEFKPIDTNVSGVQISEHLPKMAKVMDQATIVRSLFHTIPSHGPATVFMTTGNKPAMRN